ncbi:MAG TPA: glycosyltransferase family 39 protein [Kouleothrix sp.]|nr:glycosyltransferase family 39 protein [Kouleothrix sp.]
MIAQPTDFRLSAARLPRTLLYSLLALAVFAVALAWLSRPPTSLLAQGTGMYRNEGSLRWTGSQAEFPLAPHSGPTIVHLVLQFSSWSGQASAQVQLESDAGAFGSYTITPARQHLNLLLPPGATFLRLRSTLGHPPGDWRWLGVQVLAIDAQTSGWPTRALALALLYALSSLLLAWCAAWATRRGYGPLFAITLLGLLLRLLWVNDAPAMIHRDEAVSMVDAWHLARTAHDHLGHFLPLAAFEGYGDWIAPLLTYLLLPWVALFGPQPLVARVVVAVFSALAIPVIYGLVNELKLPAAALGAALVAALSPWQIYLGRVAIPPALVATMWGLSLWAAVRFVRNGRRADGLFLAGAAGLALYAYPTLKLAVPLLMLVATLLAVQRHGWRAIGRWLLPALLLGLLWLPFAISTLFNPDSSARLQLVALRADSFGQWLGLWWQNYRVYFRPDLYYGSGGLRKIVQGVLGHGLALGAEALLLLGLLVLLVRRRVVGRAETAPRQVWLFLLLMLLVAPLPASLTSGNPHAFRGATVAPLYAILAGLGAGGWWWALGQLPRAGRTWGRALATVALLAALGWQSSIWFRELLTIHRAESELTWYFADSELDAMRLVIARARAYDQVLVDTRTIGRPYIFLLADDVLPPAEAQAQIVVERHPPEINSVVQLGKYHFVDFVEQQVPAQLPTLEALPTRLGAPGYLIQEWQHNGQRVLVMRGMPTEIAAPATDDSGS